MKIAESVAEFSFYVDSKACVRVGNDASEWLPVNVILSETRLCDVSMVV